METKNMKNNQNEIKIENVVASCDLETKLPLDKIAMQIDNTEYEPEQFPGLVYRIKDPKAAALLFGSGKVVCTGTKSPEQAKIAVQKIIEELNQSNIPVKSNPIIHVQNIVASASLHEKLNLNKIAFDLEGTEYEPEQFPGLVYRLKVPKVAFLLFSSGKIVCTGGKKYEDVEIGIEKMKDNLREINALKG